MVKISEFRNLTLTFPQIIEIPQNNIINYDVNRKIFARLFPTGEIACIKIPIADQYVLTSVYKKIFYTESDLSDALGWTFVDLKKVSKENLVNALLIAYCDAAPERLSKKVIVQMNSNIFAIKKTDINRLGL